MKKNINSYLNELKCVSPEEGNFSGPFLTISRQAGCSAQRIAIKLSKILTGYSYMAETQTDADWKWVDKTVFRDAVQELIEEVKNGDYDDTDEAIHFLNEVSRSFSDETIYDISDENLIETLKSVICRLANQGRIIIVGRSAGIILRRAPNKLNIRLEAPRDWRINRLMQLKDLSRAEAEQHINNADTKRDLFIKKIMGRKVENDDFDVIFNYASLEDDYIVDAIINILKNKKIIASPNDN